MIIPLRRSWLFKERSCVYSPECTDGGPLIKAGATKVWRKAASPAAKEEMRAGALTDRGDSTGAKVIFGGFGLGLVYKILMVALQRSEDGAVNIFSAAVKACFVSLLGSTLLLSASYHIRPRYLSHSSESDLLLSLSELSRRQR